MKKNNVNLNLIHSNMFEKINKNISEKLLTKYNKWDIIISTKQKKRQLLKQEDSPMK